LDILTQKKREAKEQEKKRNAELSLKKETKEPEKS